MWNIEVLYDSRNRLDIGTSGQHPKLPKMPAKVKGWHLLFLENVITM